MQRNLLKLAPLAGVAMVVVAGMSGAAKADTAAEDAKDYRTAVMTSLRGHIGAASMQVRGIVEDHGFLSTHADALASSVLELKHLFPAGSDVEGSEALPAIWDEPEEFGTAIKKAEEATAAFSKAVAGGDKAEIGRAFRDVGAACRGCHDRFRLDTD